MTVRYETEGPITIVTIDRPEARNAVNAPTATALAEAFRRFDVDASQSVAILTGANGAFCAGYDLKQTATGHRARQRRRPALFALAGSSSPSAARISPAPSSSRSAPSRRSPIRTSFG